jgi:hypothetical protein
VGLNACLETAEKRKIIHCRESNPDRPTRRCTESHKMMRVVLALRKIGNFCRIYCIVESQTKVRSSPNLQFVRES